MISTFISLEFLLSFRLNFYFHFAWISTFISLEFLLSFRLNLYFHFVWISTFISFEFLLSFRLNFSHLIHPMLFFSSWTIKKSIYLAFIIIIQSNFNYFYFCVVLVSMSTSSVWVWNMTARVKKNKTNVSWIDIFVFSAVQLLSMVWRQFCDSSYSF